METEIVLPNETPFKVMGGKYEYERTGGNQLIETYADSYRIDSNRTD